MNFSSLKTRITFTFLVLILVIQLIGFFAIRLSVEKNAMESIDRQLRVGERVFQNLLNHRGETLSQGARILAADYGFRQAISSSDEETIISALENHGNRINADLVMLYDLNYELIGEIEAGEQNIPQFVVTSLIDTVRAGGRADGIALIGQKPYQLVAVPVRAPVEIAWVVMGFHMDNSLASNLKRLANLDLTFLISEDGNRYQTAASTLQPDMANRAAALFSGPLAKEHYTLKIVLAGHEYGAHVVDMVDSGYSIKAMLKLSVDEVLSGFIELQLYLLYLTLLGAIVFIVGSFVTAGRLTKPLKTLVMGAEELAMGNYRAEIKAKGRDEIGQLAGAFNLMRDAISSREERIRRLAYWDTLTELPNRASFIEKLHALHQRHQSDTLPFSVLVMDLDRFKQINDVLGHAMADQLLNGVARRLKTSVYREDDVVARLGGDEFGIILHDTDSAQAIEIATRLEKTLEQPIALNDQFVDLSAGIGIAGYPEHATDVETLLARAEMAMYSAKSAGEMIRVFDERIDLSESSNLSLITEIREAVEQNQLSLFIQPKVDLSTGEAIACEALVRWQHPQKGMVFPDQFIPFAEQTGHIRKISIWMLEHAIQYAMKWQQAGIHLPIAVNLSAVDLMDADLPERLIKLLQTYQVSRELISLEVTESGIMRDPAHARKTLEAISSLGIRIAIDDFGTGHSSLAYLKQLPVNELKIDRSFVMNLEHDRDDGMIVKSTIDLGHNLGLKIVAEGVENLNVWHILQSMGCDYGQGYYMSKPIHADQLMAWLEDWQLKHVQKISRTA